jgi:hypothetical protein
MFGLWIFCKRKRFVNVFDLFCEGEEKKIINFAEEGE